MQDIYLLEHSLVLVAFEVPLTISINWCFVGGVHFQDNPNLWRLEGKHPNFPSGDGHAEVGESQPPG